MIRNGRKRPEGSEDGGPPSRLVAGADLHAAGLPHWAFPEGNCTGRLLVKCKPQRWARTASLVVYFAGGLLAKSRSLPHAAAALLFAGV